MDDKSYMYITNIIAEQSPEVVLQRTSNKNNCTAMFTTKTRLIDSSALFYITEEGP